jgi:outer membrane lipoprotein-sorting protein
MRFSCWIVVVLFFNILFAENVTEIIKKSDAVMRGTTSQGEYEMIVKTPRWERTIKMENWSEGTKKAFIKINYPPRDKGVTFLKLDNEMWQYVPKVERMIKIPPSMMLQSWMGSDFTNDDLVKESSIVDDYNAKLLSENNNSWNVELTPKPDAAVTWSKVVIAIDKNTYLPKISEFYDEDGELVRVMTYSEIKKIGDRYFPMHWLIEPKTSDKEGHSTSFIVHKIIFDEKLPEDLFSLQSLKTKSK